MRTSVESKGGRLILAVCGAALAAPILAAPASSGSVRDGGTFRIAGALDAVDPAITIDAGAVLAATCAQLMHYPDRASGSNTYVGPEFAARPPEITNGGRT